MRRLSTTECTYLPTCVIWMVCASLCLGGSSCMVKITPNAPNLDHAKKLFFTGSVF